MRNGRWEDVVILRTNKLKLIKKYYISYYTGQKSKEIKAAEKRFRALNVYSINSTNVCEQYRLKNNIHT